jgi:hypothetical protein
LFEDLPERLKIFGFLADCPGALRVSQVRIGAEI